jgi:hypothetical protein
MAVAASIDPLVATQICTHFIATIPAHFCYVLIADYFERTADDAINLASKLAAN